MRIRTWRLAMIAAALAAGLALAACGGGGSSDNGAGKGQRITDPAKVPSSTPIQNPKLYRITDDVITTSGGTTGTATAGTPGTATSSGGRTYTVVSGDTCGKIATQFGVTVEALIKANSRIDAGCTNLGTGDTLRIPAAPTPAAGTAVAGSGTAKPGGRTYTVQSGDSCDAIARSQGVDLQKLIAANGLDANCQKLMPGQVLKLP
ncbi:MAG: LysM peptidoglycan-binding domain-containing protein [Chloroflexi bacterium]|nr:LysM peptidoglycan-binding domain-containing protein [Chloroflexota bacterium]